MASCDPCVRDARTRGYGNVTGNLALDTSSTLEDGRRIWHVTGDWNILVPNGGLLAGVALQAVRNDAGDEWRPSTVSCRFLRPPSRELELTIDAMRVGKRNRADHVTAYEDGERIFDALVWTVARYLGAPVDGPTLSLPPRAGLATIEERRAAVGRGPFPMPFFQNIEERPVDWVSPQERELRGATEPTLESWIRFTSTVDTGDPWITAARACVVLDSYPFFALMRSLPPADIFGATTLATDVHFEDVQSPTEWMFASVECRPSSGALMTGTGAVHNEEGRAVARVLQQLLRQERTSW